MLIDFAEICIPVVAMAWQYIGLLPEQLTGRISILHQRAVTTTVDDIEHIACRVAHSMKASLAVSLRFTSQHTR